MGLSLSSTRIQKLLKIKDGKTKHCLFEGIRRCDGLALARHLLSQTDTNIYNAWGLSPLHLAAEIGDEKLVQILLSMGADVNLSTRRNQGGVPPLVFAATNGHVSAVRMLLEAGAAVDADDDWGCTALFKAATYNHVTCVRTLLKADADPNAANRWGATALQYAAHQGHHKVVRLLLRDARCDVRMRGEETVGPPLVVAATRGYFRCVSMLLDAGAEVNVSHCVDGGSALLHAVRYYQHALNAFTGSNPVSISDRMRCIQLLLKVGATVGADTIDQLRTEDYFPHFDCEVNQRSEADLIEAVLRAYPCRRTPEDLNALRALHMEVSMTMVMNVPMMTGLLRLMCSVGLDLTDKDVEAVDYALSREELAEVNGFRKAPRSLMDSCRLAVRANLAGNSNVLAQSDKLPLPKSLKDFVTLKNPNHYSL